MLAEPPTSIATTIRRTVAAEFDSLDEPGFAPVTVRGYLLTSAATITALLLLTGAATFAA